MLHPQAHDPPESDDDRYLFRTATLGQRLLGAVADWILFYGLFFFFQCWTSHPPGDAEDIIGLSASAKHPGPAVVASLLHLLFSAWFIHGSGQTLGKVIAGTRIVDEEGRRVGLYRGFVLRTLPFLGLSFAPLLVLIVGLGFGLLDAATALNAVQVCSILVGLIGLLNMSLIFGAEHRCLHDRIAGTCVAVAGTEQPSPDEARRWHGRKKADKAPST